MPTEEGNCLYTAGYGDVQPWPNTPNYTVGTEVDGITVTLATNQWVYTGLTITSAQGLAATSGSNAGVGSGEGFFAATGAYCYPEGDYGASGPREYGYTPNLTRQIFGSNNACSNVTSHSLVIAVTANSSTPPATAPSGNATPPTVITNGLYPLRSAWWTPAQILASTGQAGGAVWAIFNDSVYNDNSCTFTLNLRSLVSASGSGTPVNFAPTTFAVSNATGCSNQITIQLVDNTGAPANAPTGGQVFTLSNGTGGTFVPSSPVTIPSGSNQITVTYYNLNSGSFAVTITPGAGPLSGMAAQTVTAQILCAPTDPYIIECPITRPFIRDAIRRNLLGFAPIDLMQGGQGAETTASYPWPSNALLNQKIAETISEVNVKAKLYTTIDLQIPVPAQTTNGQQYISLQGLSGCPSAQAVNSIKRVVFLDNVGVYHPMTATNYDEEDRIDSIMENMAPSLPMYYYTVGYNIVLYPASSTSGTLIVYAGTAVPGFYGDTDFIPQLPSDFLVGIVAGATAKTALTGMDKLNCATIYPVYKNDYDEWIRTIVGAGVNEFNVRDTPSFGFVSYRGFGSSTNRPKAIVRRNRH